MDLALSLALGVSRLSTSGIPVGDGGCTWRLGPKKSSAVVSWTTAGGLWAIGPDWGGYLETRF